MLSRRASSAVLPLAALLLALSTGQGHTAAVWNLESVDSSGSFAGHNGSDVTVDPAGNPNFSYYDAYTHDLKYALRLNGVWTHVVVDTTGDTGLWSSIALDAQGNTHISYFYNLNPQQIPVANLKYAKRSGGSWSVETVDPATAVGEYSSIGIDSQGRPHISYYDNGSGNLMHAVKSGGTWTLEVVDATGNVGAYTSLVIDTLDRVHIAYVDLTTFALKYALKSGSTWSVETAVPLVRAVNVSLALDSQNKPHIVFYDENAGKTWYGSKPGATWTSDIARALGQDLSGIFTSLAIDAQNVARMTYYDTLTEVLTYAVYDGTYWVPQTLEQYGLWTSLALDGSGHPHIAFFNVQLHRVRYGVFSDIVSDANVGGASHLVAMNVFPNPVRTAATFVLRTPATLTISLSVLDARGRLVRSIASRELPPGTHEFAWDGRDDAGGRVGAGIYFAVVRPDAFGTSQKLVVIR